jgi:aminopeptidase N
MVLFRQLEVLTSRDQVLAALKSVLGHQHALSVDELVTALSQTTGLDLTAYSAAWIHGTGKPQWPTVSLQYSAGTLTVHQATATNRTCKFHVALNGDMAGQTQLVEVDTFHNGTDQTITVTPPAFAVTSTVLDPLGECLVYGASAKAPVRFNPWVTH